MRKRLIVVGSNTFGKIVEFQFGKELLQSHKVGHLEFQRLLVEIDRSIDNDGRQSFGEESLFGVFQKVVTADNLFEK